MIHRSVELTTGDHGRSKNEPDPTASGAGSAVAPWAKWWISSARWGAIGAKTCVYVSSTCEFRSALGNQGEGEGRLTVRRVKRICRR